MSGRWRLTLEYTDPDGLGTIVDRTWAGESSFGGILGDHAGKARVLKGEDYALTLIVLAMIDSIRKKVGPWSR